jgi:hypothetical protein
VALLAPLALGGRAISAQVAANRATDYLFPTDVNDARALWVNPAGLGQWRRASVHLDATVGDPGAHGQLEQFTAGFETGGLSFGYQRDALDSSGAGHTYRGGLAVGNRSFAVGTAVAVYRGNTKGSGWDVGAVYRIGPATVGGVVRNILQPKVRGILQRVTFVPSVTLGGNGIFSLSAEGRITPDSSLGYAAGARLATPGRKSIGLFARIEADRSFRSTGWTFGLSIGRSDVLGAVASTERTESGVTALDLYGVSTRSAGR